MSPSFADAAVQAAFDAHPEPLRSALLKLRGLVLATAAQHPEIGELVETLKWGEPAYLPKTPRVGTTVRLGAPRQSAGKYAAYFHCKTTLLQTFRSIYPDEFSFEGDRAIIFSVGDDIPEAALAQCFGLALTYHLRRTA